MDYVHSSSSFGVQWTQCVGACLQSPPVEMEAGVQGGEFKRDINYISVSETKQKDTLHLKCIIQ